MKRVFATVFCVLFACTALMGCSGSEVSSQNTKVGKEALKVADRFLDGDITASQALSTLEKCKGQVTDEDGTKSKVLRSYIQNLFTAVAISTQTKGMSYSGSTLLKRRNELAKYVGESERK